jgi:hypothetical protein
MSKARARKRRDRQRRDGWPPIPPAGRLLRDARLVIDAKQTYMMRTPDGEIEAVTGAELLETADMFTALIDAQRRGDVRALQKALIRIAES